MTLGPLQDALNYQFRNTELLDQALTHKSHGKRNNERLEFLGDAVLGYTVAQLLYEHRSDLQEDDMTLVRAHLVRGSTLARKARALNLGEHLRLGAGARKSGGRERSSILADAFEAIVGAIHEDGGIEASAAFVRSVFLAELASLNAEDLKDAKTRLQEYLQGRQLKIPSYEVINVEGADHAKRYTVACIVEELEVSASAEQSSRRKAEQAAAQAVLEALGDKR